MSNLIQETPNVGNKHWQRRRLAGLWTSSVVHLAILAGMFFASMGWILADVSWDDRAITVVQVRTPKQDPEEEKPQVRVVTEPSQVAGNMIEERLNEHIIAAQGRSEDENLQQFDRFGKKLDRVSSEESLDKLASTFRNWTGAKQRATQPAEQQVAGMFDFDSGQMHDVRREDDGEGGWIYWVILIDAEGRTFESKVDQAEGERFYKTNQRLKAFPLAEKVYRQFAMPLIDKLIKAKREAQNMKDPLAPLPDQDVVQPEALTDEGSRH